MAAGHIPRAVVVFGPLVDILYEKMCEEVPYKFVHCKPGQFYFLDSPLTKQQHDSNIQEIIHGRQTEGRDKQEHRQTYD